MEETTTARRVASVALLQRSRRILRIPGGWALGATIAMIYALISMFFGGMIVLGTVRTQYGLFVLWGSGTGQAPWNYPGLILVAPWGVVTLPFFATITMIIVSIGVGIGMGVAVVLTLRLVKTRRSEAAGATAVGSVAGISPAIIALVTLGACCSTSAAATAGITLIAHASGTTSYNLLANSWYLGVFQMGVLWVALVAQEQLIAVYGDLWGVGTRSPSLTAQTMPPISPRFVLGGILRVALLVTSVLWTLTMVASWIAIAPLSASATLWGGWTFQHLLVPGLIGAAALAPVALARIFDWHGPAKRGTQLLRAFLFLGGVSLAIGLPFPLSAGGWYGLGNLLLGVAGAPSTWGSVGAGTALSLGLLVRWALEYLLLGAYAMLLALRPQIALRPLMWTVARSRNRTAPSSAPPTSVPAQ
jgi:hypothetical protein